VVARRVALLRCSQALGLVDLLAQLETLRHAGLGAALLQTRHTSTVLTLVALVTLACAVEAQPVLRALVELSACLETAVVAREARFAVARMCLGVALSVVGARVGAILILAVRSTEVGGTVAGAIEASAMGLIAATSASSKGTIIAGESIVAVTQSSPLLAHSVAIAVTRAALAR